MKMDKSKWGKKTFDDVCIIKNGKDHKRVNSPQGRYPIYGSGGKIGYAIEFLCNPGTTIIGRKGTINSPIFVNEKFWNIDTAFGLEPKSCVIPKFFFYSCLHFDFRKIQSGAAIPSLTQKDIKKQPFAVPPIAEQRTIASELDAIQAMIDGYKAQIADFDALSQSVFLDTFGDPVANPKGWKVKELKDICEVTSSKRIYQSEQTKEGVPFYRIGDFTKLIDNNSIMPELYISQERFNELRSKNLVPQKDDILITSRGTLGLCYIIKETDCFYFQDGMITWLKNIKEEILSIFLGFIFKASLLNEQIQKVQNGSTVAYLSISMIRKLVVPVPPLALQQQFAAQVEAIEQQKALLREQLADAEMLMAERMQYYFT